MFYPLRSTPFTSTLSRSYVLPAILFNPILFLHSLNAILSRILTPVIIPNVAVQPAPYTAKGPSAQHPHLDVHASDRLCWSYTIVMVGVQLVAFSRVQRRREERKERVRRKKEGDMSNVSQEIGWGMDGGSDGAYQKSAGPASPNGRSLDSSSSYGSNEYPRKTVVVPDDPIDESGSEESEVIF